MKDKTEISIVDLIEPPYAVAQITGSFKILAGNIKERLDILSLELTKEKKETTNYKMLQYGVKELIKLSAKLSKYYQD